MAKRGIPVSRKELLESVWGLHFDPGTNVVDVHVRRLRKKLDEPFETPRIFEPFVSGPPEPGRRRGYGLGLSICRSVMGDHRGSIHFEHREPRGTRFTAEFSRRA